MIRNDKGNPTRIHSLGKFEEPNARCSQRKFLLDEGILNKCEGM